MKLRSILAGTALAALALAGAPQLGITDVITRAEAAVDVNIGIFYDQLGQYGDWVSYQDDYVFIPGRVDANWRPYTEGHWVYTKRYGWTWVSDEPFGWATYHYGRWGYAEDIGWYWVPGRKWAPAWVSWRRSKNYVVWAPLPPQRRGGDVDISININVGDTPDYYWVAVPTPRFLAPDLQVVVIHDDREIRNVVQETEYVGTPRITNNIVVNNVIDVNVISQETGQKVEPVEVKTTDNPVEAKATANQVTAFQGEIAADAKAKPPKIADMSQVKKVKRNKAGVDASTTGQSDTTAAPADTTGTATAPVDNTATAPATTDATGADKTKKKKVNAGATTPADSTAPAVTGEQPATQAQDQPAGNKKKKKLQNDNATAPATGEQPVQAQDQGTGKKKKKLQNNDNAATPATGEQPVQAQDQGSGKKKKKLQQGGDEATGSTTAAPSQNGKAKPGAGNAPDQNANAPVDQKKKGKGKKDEACDPSTDANCAAAQ